MPSSSTILKVELGNMKISLLPRLSIDQNKNPSNCNQHRSPWLFVGNVIKFQHTTIYCCLHGSIIDSILRYPTPISRYSNFE